MYKIVMVIASYLLIALGLWSFWAYTSIVVPIASGDFSNSGSADWALYCIVLVIFIYGIYFLRAYPRR